jgi:hypothetical protein
MLSSGGVRLAYMLSQRLSQPHLRVCENYQPFGQCHCLFIVLMQPGTVDPLFQSEGLLDDFTVLRPKAIAFRAGFVEHFDLQLSVYTCSVLELLSLPRFPSLSALITNYLPSGVSREE